MGQQPVHGKTVSTKPQKPKPTPYTAKYLITDENKNRDGTTHTLMYLETNAYDSLGRSIIARRDYDGSGQLYSDIQVRMYDPTKNESADWSFALPASPMQVPHKVTVMRSYDRVFTNSFCIGYMGAASLPKEDRQPKAVIDAMGNQINPKLADLRDWLRTETLAPPSIEPVNRVESKHMDLGNSVINGIEAHGRRVEKSKDEYRETWMSAKRHEPVLVYDIRRTTQSTNVRQLLSLSEGEPDAELFEPPADYQVETKYFHAQSCRQ
jgi:hypothetical protein